MASRTLGDAAARTTFPGMRALPGVALQGLVLGAAASFTWWLTSTVVAGLVPESPTSRSVGTIWATVSTIFVIKMTVRASASSLVSRVVATVVSFTLCELSLLIAPPSPVSLALTIAAGAVVCHLVRHSTEVPLTSITTAVVLLAALGSERAEQWQQPLWRVGDTLVGVLVGIVVVVGEDLVRRVIRRSPSPPLPRG